MNRTCKNIWPILIFRKFGIIYVKVLIVVHSFKVFFDQVIYLNFFYNGLSIFS